MKSRDLTVKTADCADGVREVRIQTSGRPGVIVSLSCEKNRTPKIGVMMQLQDMSIEESRLLILALEKGIELAQTGCQLETKAD